MKDNNNKHITGLSLIQNTYLRNLEVRAAATAYPAIELGAAYKKWKEARGETAEMLSSSKQEISQASIHSLVSKLTERPCTKEGCNGVQRLEGICGGCVEGQAGYKSKWTCNTCMHRDLSKEDINEWMIKLSSG